MAKVEKFIPEPQPEIKINLNMAEATALVTLLGSGTESPTIKKLGLGDLYASLSGLVKEARDVCFEYSAELDYYRPI